MTTSTPPSRAGRHRSASRRRRSRSRAGRRPVLLAAELQPDQRRAAGPDADRDRRPGGELLLRRRRALRGGDPVPGHARHRRIDPGALPRQPVRDRHPHRRRRLRHHPGGHGRHLVPERADRRPRRHHRRPLARDRGRGHRRHGERRQPVERHQRDHERRHATSSTPSCGPRSSRSRSARSSIRPPPPTGWPRPPGGSRPPPPRRSGAASASGSARSATPTT